MYIARSSHYWICITLALAIIVYGMESCGITEEDGVFTNIQPINSSSWSSSDVAFFDILFNGRATSKHIALGIRFDNRMEVMSSDIEVRVSRGNNYLLVDTLQIPWATYSGERIHWGRTIHEQIAESSHILKIPITGIYRINVRPLDSIPLKGVTALGFRATDIVL